MAVPYLEYINDIVKKAILLNTEVSKKGNQSLFMNELYAVSDIGNGPELLKLYVEEMYNPGTKKDFHRSYQLQNIEKQQSIAAGSRNTVSPVKQTVDIKNIADLFEIVKQHDENFNTGKTVSPHLLKNK